MAWEKVGDVYKKKNSIGEFFGVIFGIVFWLFVIGAVLSAM
ncbi:MAG: hypothetical protein AAGA09_03165 [Pseudomonadota bacterium]